ncbi:MAG: hypothetical protein ABR579_03700, partial [Actinomycetota bacterium]
MIRARGIAIGLVLSVVVSAAVIGGATSSVAYTCSWVVVPSVDAEPVSELVAVASISPTDAWAAGNTESGDEFAASHPLLEHYDGSTWSVVSGPHSGSRGISDIGFGQSSDGWAVGSFIPTPGTRHHEARTLAEHWDGTSWKTVTTPNVGDYGSNLFGVWEHATNDVWAVGSSNKKSGASDPLALHYDGSKWSVVKTPRSKKFSRVLTTVHARSAT